MKSNHLSLQEQISEAFLVLIIGFIMFLFFLKVVLTYHCPECPLACRATVTIDTKALCQRTGALHRGFVFQTNKRSAQLVTGHKDLLVFLRTTKKLLKFPPLHGFVVPLVNNC